MNISSFHLSMFTLHKHQCNGEMFNIQHLHFISWNYVNNVLFLLSIFSSLLRFLLMCFVMFLLLLFYEATRSVHAKYPLWDSNVNRPTQ